MCAVQLPSRRRLCNEAFNKLSLSLSANIDEALLADPILIYDNMDHVEKVEFSTTMKSPPKGTYDSIASSPQSDDSATNRSPPLAIMRCCVSPDSPEFTRITPPLDNTAVLKSGRNLSIGSINFATDQSSPPPPPLNNIAVLKSGRGLSIGPMNFATNQSSPPPPLLDNTAVLKSGRGLSIGSINFATDQSSPPPLLVNKAMSTPTAVLKSGRGLSIGSINFGTDQSSPPPAKMSRVLFKSTARDWLSIVMDSDQSSRDSGFESLASTQSLEATPEKILNCHDTAAISANLIGCKNSFETSKPPISTFSPPKKFTDDELSLPGPSNCDIIAKNQASAPKNGCKVDENGKLKIPCPWDNCTLKYISVSGSEMDLALFETYQHVLREHVRPMKQALRNKCDEQVAPSSDIPSSRIRTCVVKSSSLSIGDDKLITSCTSTSISISLDKNDKSECDSSDCSDSDDDDDVINQDLPYACLWTGCKLYKRGCKVYEWLETHLLEKHGGPRPYVCVVDLCQMRFSTKFLLEKHINGHFSAKKTENGQKFTTKCAKKLTMNENGQEKLDETQMSTKKSLHCCAFTSAQQKVFKKAMAFKAVKCLQEQKQKNYRRSKCKVDETLQLSSLQLCNVSSGMEKSSPIKNDANFVETPSRKSNKQEIDQSKNDASSNSTFQCIILASRFVTENCQKEKSTSSTKKPKKSLQRPVLEFLCEFLPEGQLPPVWIREKLLEKTITVAKHKLIDYLNQCQLEKPQIDALDL